MKKLLLLQAFLCTLVDQGVHLFFSFTTNICSNKVKKSMLQNNVCFFSYGFSTQRRKLRSLKFKIINNQAIFGLSVKRCIRAICIFLVSEQRILIFKA